MNKEGYASDRLTHLCVVLEENSPAEVREIARRCGQVFGLGLYGLDMIEGPSGPVVVELWLGTASVLGVAAISYLNVYAPSGSKLPDNSDRLPLHRAK